MPQNTTIIGIINLKLDKGYTHSKIIAKNEYAIGIIGYQARATGLIGM